MRTILLGLLLILSVLVSPAHAAPFVKLSVIDPYQVLTGLQPQDTIGIAANSYWDQLDSCGFTMSMTRVDPTSTNNSIGIKVIYSPTFVSIHAPARGATNEQGRV